MVTHANGFSLDDQELMSQIRPFTKHAQVDNQFGVRLSQQIDLLRTILTLLKTTVNLAQGISHPLQRL
jgi:hypothetical protein